MHLSLQEFVKAAVAYQKKLNSLSSSSSVPSQLPLKLDSAVEIKRDRIVRSFSIARHLYTTGRSMMHSIKESELEAGAEFLEVLIASIRFTHCYFSWFSVVWSLKLALIYHMFTVKRSVEFTTAE